MKITQWLPAAFALCSLAGCMKDDDTQTTSDTDRTFMTNASYSNNAETDAGATASGMASLTAVKTFGARMVADHSSAQADMVALGTQVGKTDLPTTPDSAHSSMKAMLVRLSGRAFDSAYMKMQVTDHINAINLMQAEINNGSDQRVKNYASSHLPAIQMHKQMADSIVAANGF